MIEEETTVGKLTIPHKNNKKIDKLTFFKHRTFGFCVIVHQFRDESWVDDGKATFIVKTSELTRVE